MSEDEVFTKRARLVIEMVMLMDIESGFVSDCVEDVECNKTFGEIASTVGEDDWWGDS
jgi:hypothetical protein